MKKIIQFGLPIDDVETKPATAPVVTTPVPTPTPVTEVK